MGYDNRFPFPEVIMIDKILFIYLSGKLSREL